MRITSTQKRLAKEIRRKQLKKEFADIIDILVAEYQWEECFTPSILVPYWRQGRFSVYMVELATKGRVPISSCGTIVHRDDVEPICEWMARNGQHFFCLFDIGGKNVLSGWNERGFLKPIEINKGIFSIINA